ncbi:MAG: ABC transporter ATP-binding protein [Candidatus Tectomicrobia bacterium]|uniref:ABC transporter ATP-binding protein n=1 Tax=Tectimicrobiota bacterium TaxID=2528274 RepID=A0A933LQX1_UNCTE|nr:ABC transporter ATP-binding protein [Candidatus Tectomicrobia bacterium]
MNAHFSVLEVKELLVRMGGGFLLDIPSLRIKYGEILSLIGPNGAGKTTFLLSISHLLKPFHGEILFKGQKINSDLSLLEYRRKFTMVFQEPLLLDTDVYNNVAIGVKIRGRKKKEVRVRVMENLERFHIGHLSRRSGRNLSGGEAQRTSLARAFATQPEILLLDEPFASLDPPSRESLIEDLEQVIRQTQTTTIFATHDRIEALRLSDRIAVMNKGKIVQIGSPTAVMNHPVDEFVASFVGVETILTGRVTKINGGSFMVSINRQEVEAVGDVHLGEEVHLCIRPENVILSSPSSREITSARNVFTGRIDKIISFGAFQKVQLDCGFPLVAFVTRHSLESLSLSEGKEMIASFKATAIHVVRKWG